LSLHTLSGLFGPRVEHSSCGVGFVASRTGSYSNNILQEALHALRCVEHRGACGADQLTGDGAGVMTDIPFDLFGYKRGEIAVASLFMPRDDERRKESLRVFESTLEFYGLIVDAFRDVPVNPTVLGEEATRSMPAMTHAFIRRPVHCRTNSSFDRLLYTAKQAVRAKLSDKGINKEFFFTSLSATTIVYKALTRAEVLNQLYLDLQNPEYRTRFAMFHRRFSTNTTTSWDKAQPFRLIGHNGEINTIAGNRSWSFSREKSIGLRNDQLLTHKGISDSGSLNEMVEALMYRSSIPHIEDILAIMMPPAEEQNAYYKFWSRAMEPWDGPAIILYSDGNTVGARLDRNGFRPSRWAVTNDTFYLSSEAGSFRIDEGAILRKGTLHAGTAVKVDLENGRIHFRDASLSRENRDAQFDARTIPIASLPLSNGHDSLEPAGVSIYQRNLFSLTQEELERVLYPMIAEAREPIGSMGDTARPNVFSSEPRPFFDYFYQNFAQVTNPPLDYIREKNVTDLRVFLGRKPNIFFPKDLIPLEPAIELPSPLLSLGQMKFIEDLQTKRPSESHILPKRFSMTFPRSGGVKGFRPAVDKLAEDVLHAAESGCSVIILSDADSDSDNPPIPGLIALRAIVRRLNDSGVKLNSSLVVHSGEVRTPHHIAALLSFGASAVCPYLALHIARTDDAPSFSSLSPDKREQNLISALESGLLKIMSKSGISVVQSYISAKLFTAIGLGTELMDNFFPHNSSPMGGIGYEELAEDILWKTSLADKPEFGNRLLNTYQFREHPRGTEGEHHSLTAARSKIVHSLVRSERTPETDELYRKYVEMGEQSAPVNIRHLFDVKRSAVPVPLSDVQSREKILRRFGAGAMSFGAVNAEAQRDIILAMREIGGRSNSGEGGENPYYFTEGITATTKQVASGRFGVTAEYLISGREIQIKVAQGAKPGEGGQLMSVKVNADIARARYSLPNVDLISPPPLHDIYSIEDLKELIYELKQIHPAAEISVKLVSGSNVGTIAVGVAKAGADIIYIAGGDGGTGAATLGSMKHAGLPFEFGVAEAHRALVENRMRGTVKLRTDGGLLTGKDVIIAALLGAEGYDFGKLLLVAEGCIMARICEKNTCPTGIATHDPKFKAKYRGDKNHIVRMMHLLADDVRSYLSAMGVRTVDEIIGRTDLLTVAERHAEFIRQRKLDISKFLESPAPHSGLSIKRYAEGTGALNKQIVEDTRKAVATNAETSFKYEISTVDRGIPASLSGEIARKAYEERLRGNLSVNLAPFTGQLQLEFEGSAGQGFGVFLVEGVHLKLFGEANDSVCKSMSGGSAVIVPHRRASFKPEENAIIGNCALYGATGGRLFVHGQAGDRFAVRNSGATAVVEGVGLHACEYMTRGTVAILGKVSHNVGAGMTGGILYLQKQYDRFVNNVYLSQVDMNADESDAFRNVLTEYADAVGSETAKRLLDRWDITLSEFAAYLPKAVAYSRLRQEVMP
jgi:glutamate synthase domain-containing protein 2/glutamate synthase domain-containing protein 1/glutamate synthase domain-containing protein 3